MNELADTSVLSVLGSAFWEILIKSTIAIGLGAAACELLHRHSAAVRHRIWVFALAASLVVPLAPLLFPEVAFRVLPSLSEVPRGAVSTGISSDPILISSADPAFSSDGISPRTLDAQSTTASAQDNPAIRQRSAGDSPIPTVPKRIEQWLVTSWLFGTLTCSTFFVITFAMQWYRLRQLGPIDDEDWAASVAAAANSLGLQRPIVTFESKQGCVPAVVGVLAPRLLVPGDWRTWSGTQRRCILLHELAHIKRRDVLAQLIGRIAMLLHWFNPLVWYAVRQLRAERELASDDCVLLAGQSASDYAEQLLRTLKSYRATAMIVGVAMAHSARLDQRVLAILDPKRRRGPVGSRLGAALGCVVGILCVAIGGATFVSHEATAQPPDPEISVDSDGGVWQETYTIEYPGSLPVSVEFSGDGEMLLTGDTSGELMALIFDRDQAMWRWKAKVEGSHASAAFSADQKEIYATTEDGIRILDVDQGNEVARIEEQDSHPTLVGVFPNKTIAEQYTRQKIIFATPRGYVVKSWFKGKLPDTVATLRTNLLADGAEPEDELVLPLTVDPKGRSAIIGGPIDATGTVTGVKGKNILWAYVCGDYEEGSPGNRVMVGHTATVLSAVWSNDGSTAVTGDVDGRVIIWDATTMKESSRLEFGGRVAALAISEDGRRMAASVVSKQGEVFVWETDQPIGTIKPIHTDLSDFDGPMSYASLDFAPGGKRLAGCAINKKWLNRLGQLVGKVHVWDLAGAPYTQLPPKHAYTKTLPQGSSSSFVILHDHSIVTPVPGEGAIDFRSVTDGGIQMRTVLGEFAIGSLKLSDDRRWLAMEQHAVAPRGDLLFPPSREFDVGVMDMKTLKQVTTIGSCSRMLDIASGGKAVAVVRDKEIELWDVATSKRLTEAPFEHSRLDAASFSPDGKLLAISDRNDLVLWHWEKNTHERIDLGRSVGSLAFSPDGSFLAEGPTPRENIQIRNIHTRQIVQTLANDTGRSMNVRGMAYSQGGRVLIGCDDITFIKEIPVPHRINLWDTASGSLVHQLQIPAGRPKNLAVSPNGRYLIAMFEDDEGLKMTAWRLDGQQLAESAEPKPPAQLSPR